MFEALEFGPFILWTHVLFLALAVWLSSEFFLRLATSAGLSLQNFRDNGWWYVGAFLVSGRIFAMLAQYRVYLRDPLRMFVVWDGQFSFLGGAIGIAIVLYTVTKGSRTTFLQWLDALLPATAFGLSLDWLGKFAAGQAYGAPTDMFWGVTYDAINVRFAVPIHPVQLYYAVFFFVLTFILLIVRKHAAHAGAETLTGIVCASLATFVFEVFRGDFGVPVFATKLDFLLLVLLFLGLGIFSIVELKLTQRAMIVYELCMAAVFGAYILLRPWIAFPSTELRFSQLLAVLALLAAIVYVVVHRRRYPHL